MASRLTVQHRRWRQQCVPQKCWAFSNMHSITIQNTIFCNIAVMITWVQDETEFKSGILLRRLWFAGMWSCVVIANRYQHSRGTCCLQVGPRLWYLISHTTWCHISEIAILTFAIMRISDLASWTQKLCIEGIVLHVVYPKLRHTDLFV
jgi:hypothetical protein